MSELTILHLNCAFFRGESTGFPVFRSGADIEGNIKTLADIINEEDVDVVTLNEVEKDSTHSGRIDHVAMLKELTGLEHAVYGECYSHRCSDVPVIGWIPGLDKIIEFLVPYRISSGNAILSKYPITESENKKYTYPWSPIRKMLSPRWYLHWGGHHLLKAKIDYDGEPVDIWCTHLIHKDPDLRFHQATELAMEMNGGRKKDGRVLVAAGDLNAVSPGAKVKSGFKLDNELYRGKVVQIFKSVEPSLATYVCDDNPEHYTYPTEAPDRRIDWQFFSWRTLELAHYAVIGKDRRPWISDHFGVIARYKRRHREIKRLILPVA